MRPITLNHDEPPRITVRFNKLAGTTHETFWRLDYDDLGDVISAPDLTGYTANCQLYTYNTATWAYDIAADLLTDFVLVNGNVTLKTKPTRTVSNAFGFRLNLSNAKTQAFTWLKAAGVIVMTSPGGISSGLAFLEMVAVDVSECGCG